jgi:hypothetical protein
MIIRKSKFLLISAQDKQAHINILQEKTSLKKLFPQLLLNNIVIALRLSVAWTLMSSS